MDSFTYYFDVKFLSTTDFDSFFSKQIIEDIKPSMVVSDKIITDASTLKFQRTKYMSNKKRKHT